MHAETLNPQSEMKQDAIKFIGYFLLAGFFMPIVISGFGMTKILFINISGLGKGSLFQTLTLIYPLLAGVAALWVGRRVEPPARPITLLAVGLFPIVLALGDDMVSGSLRGIKFQTVTTLIMVLSVIGLFVGNRHFSKTGYVSGRLIAAISGGAFMVLALVPITGTKPMFFSLFDFFKMGKISGSFTFLGLALIAVFLCYGWAALTALINLKDPPNADETSGRAAGLVFWSSWGIPVSFLLVSVTTGGFFMVLIAFLKFTLWIGGIIGLIGWAWLDLLEELEPEAKTGAQLFEESQGSAPPADRPPPNIWDGPPPPE